MYVYIFFIMNIDYQSIVLYLNMQGKSKYEILSEMNNTFQKDVIKYSTITKYIRQISFQSNKVGSDKKDENYEHLLLQNIILKILKDFPFNSIREIADMSNIPKSTVHRILTSELHYVPVHLRWVPHFLNFDQKAARVELSKSLLRTLQKAQHQNFSFFFTGDESWLYLSTSHELQWIPQGEKPSTREKKMIGSKKYMLSVFWNPDGFLIIDILPDDFRFTSEYFINNILEKIYEATKTLREKEHRKIIIHFDNARPHTSRKVVEYMDLHSMKRAPHPAYSPDIAASDFYLFGYLKNELEGEEFETADQLFDAIQKILSEISHDTLNKVFLEWMKRLQQVIDNNGNYIE